MINYKENLINLNNEFRSFEPIGKLMKYRMLTNEEMMDRDRCEAAREAYETLDWFNGQRNLEPDTFFASPFYYLQKMCKKYDIEQNDNYYIEDFKRFVTLEKNEDYLNMNNNRAQYLRKEWFCLKSTKEHYQKIFNNDDVIYYVDSAHKIGAFHIIPKGFGYMPKCKWLLDDGMKSLMVIEDNWEYIKKFYGDISFEEYKSKFCLEDAYCNDKLRKELMINFNMTWDELFLTLRNLADLINKRTLSVIHKLEESEKNEQRM